VCAVGAWQQTIFRTGVEYVELDVVVTDKNDRPVRDLTKDDFEIVEKGATQAIANFQAISIPAVRRELPDPKTALPSLDVASNAHAPLGRQWVLVIDDLHIIETHIIHTQRVLKEFFEQLPPEDSVAVVFVGRSDLSQNFTSDLGALVRTSNRIKDALGFAYDAADFGGGSAVAGIAAADRKNYGIAATDVMKNITRALINSTYPRKALVYVSEGMTYEFRPGPDYTGEIFDRMTELFQAARRAGVPVYTVDPRGVPDCTAYRRMCGDPGSDGRIKWQQIQMRTLAENTGGRAFVNMSDMPRAIHELIDDNSSFYLLGYYPEPLVRDGKFHEVDVRIRGRKELKVRARAGYMSPKPSKATTEDAKLTLEDALSAALPVPALELRAAAAPVAVGDKGMTTAVTLEVRYPEQPAGKVDDTLLFGIVALDLDGKIKAQMRGTYKYSATVKAGQPIVYAVNATIDVPSQPLTLRVAVSSQLLDRAASIHLPVEAINPSKSEIQFGSILLGFAGPARQTAVPTGALKGLVPIQPTMARTFSEKDTLQVFAPVFWRATSNMASREETAIVTVTIRSHGQAVLESRATVLGEPAKSPRIPRSVLGQLVGAAPLKQLLPGPYVLELTGRLPTGGAVARKELAFDIK
jgi:VWFA-related protein